MSKIILLDAGHGGVIDGVYQTDGKRAYFKNKRLMNVKGLGRKYCEENCDHKHYEGEVNRIIRDFIVTGLEQFGIDYRIINPGNDDMRLSSRVTIANEHCKEYGAENCIYISIHSNGFSNQQAHGFSFYTSIGQTASDPYAQFLYEEAQEMFPYEYMRTDKDDGDLDKEANFYVLKNTNCPAVLGEMFFHTNYREYMLYLGDKVGQEMIADVYIAGIRKMVDDI